MKSIVRVILAVTAHWCVRFRSNSRGNVAIIFAFASVPIAIGVGAGIDLSGAYGARQKLSEAATLTCQYSTRTSVVNIAANPGNTFQTYTTAVNTFATNALTAQHLTASNVTPAGSYFTATSASTGPTNGVTDMTMSYPTSFLKIIHVTSISVHARIGCQTPTSTTSSTPGSYVLQEGFETSCASYCFTQPSGVTGALTNPTTTFGSAPTYVGSGGFQFYVIGYCLEVDYQGIINSADPEKTHSAELDCDNSNHTAGNSSLSTKIFLSNGQYELRYFYRSRVQYPNYDPYYICGQTLADVSWANDTNSVGDPVITNALRTNQMNVYLDTATNAGTPPLHSTMTTPHSASIQLAGSNLIDVCVYAPKWIERSVTINVTTPGYYWLSFAADGENDSYGAQLDNIRVCVVTCPGTQQDNFPDTNPYAAQWVMPTQNATMATELGANIWNWATYNGSGLNYRTTMCTLTSFNSCSNYSRTGNSNANVLLDPGFYKLTYQYTSPVKFQNPPSLASTTGCDATPAQSDITAFQAQSGKSTNPVVGSSGKYNSYADISMIGAFLTFPGQTLAPVASATTSATSPLIDLCYYTQTYNSTHDVYFKVTKPGYYNLTYYALGTLTSSLGATNTKYLGGAINVSNLTLVSAGSPFAMSMSSSCSVVAVPDPQVGSPQTPSGGQSGFTFTATDPFLQGASAQACP